MESEGLNFDRQAGKHVQAYLDYLDMGGRDDEYSENAYKELQAKQIEYSKNKLYVTWRNENGKDCKNIGGASKCFCDHR